MKKILVCLSSVALAAPAEASSIRGALGNFDAINETGQTVYGIEIEIDDIRSKNVSSTYPGNHYGYGKIREDLSDPAHPKVFVRYDEPNPHGVYTGYTIAPPSPPPSCYNLAINVGCEHFGVHLNTIAYTAVKYNWLVKDASGQLIVGPALNMTNPTFVYTPPVTGFPAQVVATIPAPVVQQPVIKEFGQPSWVKVIKTTTHKTQPLPLAGLISEDHDNDGAIDWTNGEPAEVESEWYLLQNRANGTSAKNELAGNPDKMGDNGDEVVTRRYEFYAYAGPAESIDSENGEAMCDKVGPDNVSGDGVVGVTDAFGGSHDFDCSTVPVVGAFRGSQMTEFLALSPFEATDALQNGKVNETYPERPLVGGGNTPYNVSIGSGALPSGLLLDSTAGLIYGVPSKVGVFTFGVSASDNDGTLAAKQFTIKVTGPGDVDADNDIDIADLNAIKAKFGSLVTANNPADLNGDLFVNIADYRKAATLCTKPRCALVTPAP